MEKRLAQIQERAAQILRELENAELTADMISALEEEQRSLEAEADTIKRKMSLSGKLSSMEGEAAPTEGEPTAEQRAAQIQKEGRMTISATEVRSAIAQRSTTIATDTLLMPTKNGNEIHDNLNPVSSIIDQVSVVDATGAAAYEEAYVKAEPTADKRTDGQAPASDSDSDAVFRVAKLSPSLINVTSYVSRNIQRVSPLAYEAKIKSLALKALRRKIAELVVNGNDEVFGIKTAKNTKNEDISKELLVDAAAFGPDTLSNIVFAYGGNDELGGNARLFLTKADLQAFGAVRGTNEKKALYEITPDSQNPNIGTIKEGGLIVPYTICSSLTPLAGATKKASKQQTMIYGDPANFELALFGDYSVEVYKETKAVEGMLTIIGEQMAGGNVIVDGGFVIVTLNATE